MTKTTVLVVEDEFLISQFVSQELAALDYDVLTASNADEAIAILESRDDIHTVFTDINMPGSMDGLRLAAAVRVRWPPVKIVITTGKQRPPEAAMPDGSLFLAKPYASHDIVRTMRQLD
ncbi:MAG: response regulator [Pseudolabrys sp.]